MAKVEVEVAEWQLPTLRTYLEAFWDLEITRDNLSIDEEKAIKQRAWQARVDSLLVPIPQDLTIPVGNSYKRLFEETFAPKSDKRIPKKVTMQPLDNTKLNELQAVFHGLFQGDDIDSWLDAKGAAAIIEYYGLKTGHQRSYRDLAPDLFMSESWANQLARRVQGVLYYPRSSTAREALIPRFATVESV